MTSLAVFVWRTYRPAAVAAAAAAARDPLVAVRVFAAQSAGRGVVDFAAHGVRSVAPPPPWSRSASTACDVEALASVRDAAAPRGARSCRRRRDRRMRLWRSPWRRPRGSLTLRSVISSACRSRDDGRAWRSPPWCLRRRRLPLAAFSAAAAYLARIRAAAGGLSAARAGKARRARSPRASFLPPRRKRWIRSTTPACPTARRPVPPPLPRAVARPSRPCMCTEDARLVRIALRGRDVRAP